MNADLKGLQNYAKKRKLTYIETDKGRKLSHTEAVAFVDWGLENGYTDLESMPEFETIQKELKL